MARIKSRWVVKAGSNMVVSGGPLLLRSWMQQVSELRRKHGVEVIWVSSGAIATAVERKDFRKKDRTLSEKQALSAIGQPIVMDLYNLSLGMVGALGAQVLLTADDLRDRVRRANLQNTLNQLLKWEVTPILNENDAVATEEIKFGDNDSLSAKVAAALGADRLVILTDVPGYFEADPRTNPGARLVRWVPKVTPAMLKTTGKSAGSSRGTGGMFSKLQAAQMASKDGIETWLAQGDVPSILLRVAENAAIGTKIGGKRPK
jgi:glutamate 5-kinase